MMVVMPEFLSTQTVCRHQANEWKRLLEDLKDDIKNNIEQMDFENAKQYDEMRQIAFKMIHKVNGLIDDIESTHFESLD